VNVVRTAWIVTPPGAKLEVALDVGEVRARDGREAISEVEIEAVEGDPGAAFELAMRILDDIPMRPSAVTKAERGYRLARGAPRAAVHARTVVLDASMTPRAAASELIGAALEQLQANEDGVLESEDAEFVHQARVALRRIRSTLRIFRAVIGRERSRAWRGAPATAASPPAPRRARPLRRPATRAPCSTSRAGWRSWSWFRRRERPTRWKSSPGA